MFSTCLYVTLPFSYLHVHTTHAYDTPCVAKRSKPLNASDTQWSSGTFEPATDIPINVVPKNHFAKVTQNSEAFYKGSYKCNSEYTAV